MDEERSVQRLVECFAGQTPSCIREIDCSCVTLRHIKKSCYFLYYEKVVTLWFLLMVTPNNCNGLGLYRVG